MDAFIKSSQEEHEAIKELIIFYVEINRKRKQYLTMQII